MPIPVIYRKSGESAIASYSFTDISSGTGIVAFYLAETLETSTKSYIITTNPIFSNDISTVTGTLSGTLAIAKVLDLDFDTVFNLPQRIRGTAYCNLTISATSNTGASFYGIVKLRKVSGGVESEIANAQTEQQNIGGTTGYKELAVQIPITTIASFRKGDTFRCTVEVWESQASGATTVTLYHDPQARTTLTNANSQLKLYIPFVLDI